MEDTLSIRWTGQIVYPFWLNLDVSKKQLTEEYSNCAAEEA